jgi:hypothetical protein
VSPRTSPEHTASGASAWVVADDNDAARRLYRRLGYRERANRPMVKDAWEGPGAEWLLMIKELDAQVGPPGR